MGLESGPEAAFEPAETREDRVLPTVPGVLNRTAGKWRETGAEHDAGVEQIDVVDDAFAETGKSVKHVPYRTVTNISIKRSTSSSVGGAKLPLRTGFPFSYL